MIISFSGEYEFLSNFYPCIIKEDTVRLIKRTLFGIKKYTFDGEFNWSSAEHYYQSLKTKDLKEKQKIFSCETPGKAKRMGEKLKLISHWKDIKVPNMEYVIVEKFRQNRELQQKLVNTYPERLVEGNYWHDNFWGRCFCDKCKKTMGKNNLGIILMSVRNQYRIINGG